MEFTRSILSGVNYGFTHNVSTDPVVLVANQPTITHDFVLNVDLLQSWSYEWQLQHAIDVVNQHYDTIKAILRGVIDARDTGEPDTDNTASMCE